MRVQFGANHDTGAHHGPHARQKIAFAVVIAVGHHGTVQTQQHHIDRQCGAQVGQQFIAQRFIGVAGGGATGLCTGNHAFHQIPAIALAAQPCCPQRAGEQCHLIGMLARREVAAVMEGRQPGGHGREGVGFGGEAAAEDAHGNGPVCCGWMGGQKQKRGHGRVQAERFSRVYSTLALARRSSWYFASFCCVSCWAICGLTSSNLGSCASRVSSSRMM